MAEESEKVRENRLRRMADRQGLRLVKSRARDANALHHGLYALLSIEHGGAVHPHLEADRRQPYALNLDEVEAYLSGGKGDD